MCRVCSHCRSGVSLNVAAFFSPGFHLLWVIEALGESKGLKGPGSLQSKVRPGWRAFEEKTNPAPCSAQTLK